MLEIFDRWRKQLRIRYLGLIEARGVRQFCFHDLETNTNFHVPRPEQLEQTLAVHRHRTETKMTNERSSQDLAVASTGNTSGRFQITEREAEQMIRESL